MSGSRILNDPYVAAFSAGAPERARHYREQAEKFRQMAKAETDENLREAISALATQYDELANRLDPPSAGEAPKRVRSVGDPERD
jgi:hypothetical protein